jgi:hypothetical protein
MFFFVEPMMPLTPAERKKYLVELKAKKAVDGYATSDPAGVMRRKTKRKDIPSREEIAPGQASMNVDQTEVAGDGDGVETVESPKRKKGKTGKSDTRRLHLMGVDANDKNDKTVATTSLNEKVTGSFWHKDFDFRRYNIFLILKRFHC